MSATSKRPSEPKKKPSRRHPSHDVQTKCAAVLSIWSERRKPAEVCRELGINWPTLNQWQNRAMEGMLQALEPKSDQPRTASELNPSIEQRLRRNLERRQAKQTRLQRRLNGLLKPASSQNQSMKSLSKEATPVSTAVKIGP